MPDIDTLLKSVAPEVRPPSADQVSADLARGRAALTVARRRRTLFGFGSGVAVVTAAVAAVVVVSSGSTSAGPRPAAGLTTSHPHLAIAPGRRSAQHGSTSGPRVELVDYTGAQLPGFTVSEIPQGWHLSTSSSTALLITRDGSTNNDPDDFSGKLAVLVQSVDEHGLGAGTPVTVDGSPARFDAGQADEPAGFGPTLRFTSGGHAVDIQTPSTLHWGPSQLIAFAEHVTVTKDVGVTRG